MSEKIIDMFIYIRLVSGFDFRYIFNGWGVVGHGFLDYF